MKDTIFRCKIAHPGPYGRHLQLVQMELRALYIKNEDLRKERDAKVEIERCLREIARVREENDRLREELASEAVTA